MKITVRIHEEKDGYWAEFPALPGCTTHADTREQLMKNIPEAIDCHLSGGDSNPPEKLGDDVKVIKITI